MIVSIKEYSDYLGLTIINKYGNKEVLIDKSDYDKIKELNWNIMPDKCFNTFYCFSKKGLMHRFIMDCPKNLVIDHINHNGLDNRKSNLKICSQLENMQNQRLRKTNSSGYSNICFDKERNEWCVYFNVNKKKKKIARVKNLEDAVRIRDNFRSNLCTQ